MENEYLKEIERLKSECVRLEEQVRLLFVVEINLRRTKADLSKSKKQIEEYNRTLEQRVEERTTELKKAQQQLIENAHKAGMAEIATDVVHNIGNILNSVRICSEEINSTVSHSAIPEFIKVNELLQKNRSDIGSFFSDNPQGKSLLDYFVLLSDAFKAEQDKLKNETASLQQKIETIRAVMLTQQEYAFSHIMIEQIDLIVVVEDALKILKERLSEAKIQIKRNFKQQEKFVISAQKTKLMQILINLFVNASEALIHNGTDNRFITIDFNHSEKGDIILEIADNGEGIDASNLKKIFTHGFTTKASGHGFGLHNSANFMDDIEGSISVESKGIGQGSKFTLLFPMSSR